MLPVNIYNIHVFYYLNLNCCKVAYTFKTCIKYEKYLNIRNVEIRKNITRLRISAHKLRIETERFNNKLQYIPPEMRTCLNCNRKETEDEFHVIIACPKYSSFRDDLFQNAKY